MRVSDARVVNTEARDGDLAFARREASGADRVRWEEHVDDDGPEDGDGAGDEVHVLPGVEGAAGNMAETVVDKGGDDGDVA
jgi:hypothetical protein